MDAGQIYNSWPLMGSNYFPDDNPQLNPINRWRSHAHLLYGNWVNEIYQTTPFEIEKIGLKHP